MTDQLSGSDASKPKPVTVFVPLVGSETADFMTVDCVRRSDESPQRWIASGLGVDPESLEEILTESRDDEDGSLAFTKVRVSVHPRQFIGKSHGLAIALADKLARYSCAGPAVPLIATGTVLTNRRGDIGPVDGFEKKVVLVRERAEPGSVFIYPAENQSDAADLLRIVESENKIRLFPVRHLNDLVQLWEIETPFAQPGSFSRTLLKAAATGIVVLAVGIGGFLVVSGKPKPAATASSEPASLTSEEPVTKIAPIDFRESINVDQTVVRKILPLRPLPLTKNKIDKNPRFPPRIWVNDPS